MPTPDFAKMVPGFDFLQSLMKSAGSSLPSMNQWIAPTLDPEEVDQRIQQLRTVQIWLDSNAKMLGATIQALEVQRMTLSTLRTMNLPIGDLRDAMKLDPKAFMPAAAEPAAAPAAKSASTTGGAKAKTKPSAAKTKPAAKPAPAAVDPLQWWGALTRQFTELAANAVKDNPMEAASQMSQAAGAALKQAVQPMTDAAKAMTAATAKATKAVPAQAAQAVVKTAAKSALKAATRGSRRR